MEGNTIILFFLIGLALIGVCVIAIALIKTVPVVTQSMDNFNSTIPQPTAKTYSVFNNGIIYAVAGATALLIMFFVVLAVKTR